MAGTRTRGFTLVELMVTIVVLVILMSVAVPSFDNIRLSSRLNSYSTDLVAGSQVARSEAIKRNAQVRLCVSSNGTSCATTGQWETGWIVISTDGVVIQKQPATASGYQIRDGGGLSALAFEATGVGATAANFTICRASPVGSQERVVKVSATGRSSITRTSTGICGV
ncbi:GspH/FimT family pseudopilin [Variovorax sp. V213]|jgi:type IV fimbrial biogenesis protein FimT|uniref:GspH/FimT family pseudopilin n=1 Tax=Variovorax sp. V213 TaxID=3065955 RepID=UPI0034E8446F